MSMKTALLALANNIGMCQENARSIKLELTRGLSEAAEAELYHVVQEVAADGVKSYSALLDELFDKAIVSTGKVLMLDMGNVQFYGYPTRHAADSVEFEELRVRSTGLNGHGFVVKKTGSEYYTTSNGTTTDTKSNVPASGVKIVLFD